MIPENTSSLKLGWIAKLRFYGSEQEVPDSPPLYLCFITAITAITANSKRDINSSLV
jgi:hypothetical protein